MKYLTVQELRGIVSLVEALNTNLAGQPVSLLTTDIVDSNGDTVGRIGITEDGDYGYIIEDDPTD